MSPEAEKQEIDIEIGREMVNSIIETAIEDYRALCKLRIIKNGRLAPTWPKHNDKKIKYQQYCYPVQVQQLLYFFLGGRFEKLLDMTGIQLSAEGILRNLGILRPWQAKIEWYGCTKMG